MTTISTTVDPGSRPEPVGTMRLLAALILLAVAWLGLEAIERPVVRLMLDMTGGSPQDGVLTLHRYLLIGLVRVLWWLAAALLVARMTSRRPAELDWHGRSSARDLGAGILGGTIGIAATVGLIVAAGGARLLPPDANVGSWGPEGTAWLLGEMQIAAAEELLFRATLFVLLRRWAGTGVALALTAILFAAAHGDRAAEPLFALHLAAAGVTLGLALLRSGAVWLPIGFHAGWNWSCAMLFGAINSGQANAGHIFRFVGTGPPWLDGGAIGPEGSVFALAGNLVELMLVLWWTRPSGRAVVVGKAHD